MELEKLLQEAFKQGENGAITFEQLKAFITEKKLKLADLSTGKYVDKQKYDDDLGKKDKQIETLNNTIADRDKDLETIKKDLENAGEDKTKLETLSNSLADLQSKYDTDTKNYQEKLSQQAYEFAVKDYANTQKFTSNAAKRDFIKSMTDMQLKMDKGTILGADDFANKYFTENADAKLIDDNQNNNTDNPEPPAPHFVQPTGGEHNANNDDANPFHFNFTGVRPRESK